MATLLIAACGGTVPATQVMVFVDAEPGVRALTDTLRIRVDGATGRDDHTFALREQSDVVAPRWPTRLALLPLDGDPHRVYRVTVTALDGTAEVAQARVVSGYRPGETARIDLWLEDSCVGHAPCGEQETCSRGECQPAEIDPGALLPYETMPDAALASPDAGSPDTGAPVDALGLDARGVDAPGIDAPAIDAAVDAPGLDALSSDACGRPEICNSMDDDCDGRMDEGFDLTSDPANCGSCGRPCGSGETCSASACVTAASWTVGMGIGDSGTPSLLSSVVDPSGNLYVWGAVLEDEVRVGSVSVVAPVPEWVYFLTRIDPDGSFRWVRVFGPIRTGTAEGGKLALRPGGGVTLTVGWRPPSDGSAGGWPAPV